MMVVFLVAWTHQSRPTAVFQFLVQVPASFIFFFFFLLFFHLRYCGAGTGRHVNVLAAMISEKAEDDRLGKIEYESREFLVDKMSCGGTWLYT